MQNPAKPPDNTESQPTLRTSNSAVDTCLAFMLRAGRITRLLPRVRGFYKLRNFYQRHLPQGFLARTKFDGDLILDLDLRDNLGLFLWHYPSFYEKEEIESFCSLVTPGCIVLDVGANVGLYTLLAAKRGARVFAIEADPHNATRLRHHAKLNRVESRVTILEMAATETEQTISLYRNPQNWGESNILHRGNFYGTVAGRTIDSLNLPPVDICKMDIEGAEVLALQGMERTLARSPHINLFVEYAEAFENSAALLHFLRTHFSTLTVLEANEGQGDIPPFCNILASR
jgi:FkbM family methyltransferase